MVGSLVGVTQKVTPLLQKPTVQLGEVDLCDPLPTLYWLVWGIVFCRPNKASIAAMDQDCNVYTMLRWHFVSQCSLSSFPTLLSSPFICSPCISSPCLFFPPLLSTLLSFFEEDLFILFKYDGCFACIYAYVPCEYSVRGAQKRWLDSL